jgi:hypothetical protein
MTAEGTTGGAGADWSSAWLDGLAFAAGLALAWFGHWQTKDLVWSLWLSSLMVGYAMIVWMIFSPAIYTVTRVWADRGAIESAPTAKAAGFGAIYLVGALFMLAFFTVHFGMFHFVHSVFLNLFFPVTAGRAAGPSAQLYLEVVAAYWPFVLVAAVAERQAFRWPSEFVATTVPDTSVKAADIAARKARNAGMSGMTGMMTPYKNVIRLHLLIFFFAFASFAKVDSFAVYAVVYAVYFFPWRLVRRRAAPTGA